MKIVLAIPTYNRAEHLAKLLPEVIKLGFYKIFIFSIHRSSTDNSQLIYKQFPEVKVISGKKNLGPAGNRNRILGEDLGDVVFFLDDDVRLKTPKMLSILDGLYKAHPKAAIISSTVLNKNGDFVNFSFEEEVNPLFRWIERWFKGPKKAPEYFDHPYVSVAWVLENAFAIKSDLFRELNGFTEIFHKFQEGPDLCKRAKDRGHQIAITNKIIAIHTEPYSAFMPTQFPKYFRSGIIWYYKYAFGRKSL